MRLSQGNCLEASELLEKALEMYRRICEGGPPHVETLMHLAKAQQKYGKNELAVRPSEKVLSVSEAIS